MVLPGGEYPKLKPITEEGRGQVQEEQRAWLAEIIARLNELFEGDLTDQDKLVYVNDVLKGKLLESETLKEQASSNTKEQFANSPDLKAELMNAIIGALDAHTTMSSQALASEAVRNGLRDVLLNHAGLYEALRQAARPVGEQM
jgi:type I restriction enzyme R subunit